VQEKLKRHMMEKFRDAQMQQLEKAVQSGSVEGAEQLICDTIEKLKARIHLLEAQRDGAKACFRFDHLSHASFRR
jgi:hypothetical protein